MKWLSCATFSSAEDAQLILVALRRAYPTLRMKLRSNKDETDLLTSTPLEQATIIAGIIMYRQGATDAWRAANASLRNTVRPRSIYPDPGDTVK
jgi:hypothetical protein